MSCFTERPDNMRSYKACSACHQCLHTAAPMWLEFEADQFDEMLVNMLDGLAHSRALYIAKRGEVAHHARIRAACDFGAVGVEFLVEVVGHDFGANYPD